MEYNQFLINIDELKALTRDAQNAQENKYESEAKMIIDKIPMKARNAARQGKTSVAILKFNNILYPGDLVSEIVFDWCSKQGLNPTKNNGMIVIHWD